MRRAPYIDERNVDFRVEIWDRLLDEWMPAPEPHTFDERNAADDRCDELEDGHDYVRLIRVESTRTILSSGGRVDKQSLADAG